MPTNPKRFLIAPDSFKGSIDAKTAALAIQRGINRADPNAITDLFPMADGGEGTADLITQQNHGRWIAVPVTDPDGEPIQAGFGWLAQKRQAVMDIASCGGLASVGPGDLWQRHSSGAGELIRAILDFEPAELLIGLGGSASNDAGMGLLSALGLIFKDANNQPLAPTPAGLKTLDHIDCARFDPRLDQIKIRILSDVLNPLTGPDGATAVFGLQKGAHPQDLAALDQRLAQIARIVITQLEAQQKCPTPSRSLPQAPGSGAAGGIGFALRLLAQVQLVSGAESVADLIQLTAALPKADVLITGEGCFDAQSLQGKVVGTLLKLSQPYRLERIIIAGKTTDAPPLASRTRLISLTRHAGSERQAWAAPESHLETLAWQLARRVSQGH